MLDFPKRTEQVVDLSLDLIRRAYTSTDLRHSEAMRMYALRDHLREWGEQNGLAVIEMKESEDAPFPFLIFTFPEHYQDGKLTANTALLGHVDVVAPHLPGPDVQGEFLVGRGSADMLTVSASHMTWMAEQVQKEAPKPPVCVMLSFTEETGSVKANSSREAFEFARKELGARFDGIICGERTAEMKDRDDRPENPICVANRGLKILQLGQCSDDIDSDFGRESLRTLATKIAAVREMIIALNEEPSSDLMEAQDDWRSNVANTFGTIFQSADLSDRSKTLLRFRIPDSTGSHSARRDITAPHPIEIAGSFVDCLEGLGLNVQVLNGIWGDPKKGSTANTGIQLDLAVDENDPETSGLIRDLCRGSYMGGKLQRIKSRMSADSGPKNHFDARLDFRVIPEHWAAVCDQIEQFKGQVLDMDARVVIEMLPWRALIDSPFVQRLIAAYKEAYGKDPLLRGKLHANDAALAIQIVDEFGIGVLDAVVFGQAGVGPHTNNEAHWIPSIEPYMNFLDELFL